LLASFINGVHTLSDVSQDIFLVKLRGEGESSQLDTADFLFVFVLFSNGTLGARCRNCSVDEGVVLAETNARLESISF
jgi:hypothetical protein